MALDFCHVDLAWWDWTRRNPSSIDMQSLAMQVIQGLVDYSTLYLIRPIYVRSAGSAMSGGQGRLCPPHHETYRQRDNTV